MNDITFNVFKSAFIVYGIPGLIALAIILAVFFLGRYALLKWIDTRFQTSLEQYKLEAAREAEKQKHELQKLIEEKRYEINSRFDRTTRINQREFETLSLVWSELTEAFFRAKSTTFGFRHINNVENMGSDELRLYLQECDFTPSQIEHVIAADNKQDVYGRVLESKETYLTENQVREYRIKIRKLGIFVRPELRSKFDEIEAIINDALAEKYVRSLSIHSTIGFEKAELLHGRGDQIYKEIEKSIQERFWNFLISFPDIKVPDTA